MNTTDQVRACLNYRVYGNHPNVIPNLPVYRHRFDDLWRDIAGHERGECGCSAFRTGSRISVRGGRDEGGGDFQYSPDCCLVDRPNLWLHWPTGDLRARGEDGSCLQHPHDLLCKSVFKKKTLELGEECFQYLLSRFLGIPP